MFILFHLCWRHRRNSKTRAEKRRKLELDQEQAAPCCEDSPLRNTPELVVRAVYGERTRYKQDARHLLPEKKLIVPYKCEVLWGGGSLVVQKLIVQR